MTKKESQKNPLPVDKASSWKMFDEIARRYDRLNRVLSLRQDKSWRCRLGRHLPDKQEICLLDVATGTGDVLISLAQRHPHLKEGIGIDLSDGMLALGREKIRDLGLNQRIHLRHGDAQNLEFPKDTFDCATMAFGIRNVPDPQKVLQELFRVLRPGGTVLIMEFSKPTNPLIRFFHRFYLKNIVPVIGRMLSGHQYAYDYLNLTINTFPCGEEFLNLLDQAGFTNLAEDHLMFATATIYRGQKPSFSDTQ